MLRVTINGRNLEVKEGTTILQAARQNDIYIPTLCDDPRLEPYGGCRVCIVQVKGIPRPVSACTTPVTDNMEVQTSTEEIESIRRTIFELLLSDHPNDCMFCERSGECDLQDQAYLHGSRYNRFWGERRQYTKRDGNPFVERDMEKCILCGKCVRVCDEVQGVSAIDIAYRGFTAKVCPPFERDLDCEFCGQCISVCPTGALVDKTGISLKGRQRDARQIDTTCGYCGCGCTLTIHVHHNEILRITARPDTIHEGWLCVKGRFGHNFVSSPERLKKPLIKKNGVFEEVSWDEALDYVTDRMREMKFDLGPEVIAGLSSARCTNEENYLFQKYMRAVIRTNNIDHCARY